MSSGVPDVQKTDLATGPSLPLRFPPDRGGIGYKESHAREATEVR